MAKSVLVLLALAAFEMQAQNQATNAPQPKTSQNSTSYSAGSKEDLSRMAGNMLDQVDRARLALKSNNVQAALQDVTKAQADLRRINAHADGSTMIPVYQEFVSISILSPVVAEHQARANGGGTNGNTAANNTKAGNQPVAAPANNNAVVHEVAGDYTDVMVNTTVAKNSLAAAIWNLNRGNVKAADAALADVQEGVEVQSVESDMPLAQVRENLILARSAARVGKYTEARNALQAASKALTKFEAENGPHVSEAKAMQQQIDEYANHVEQDHAQVVAKINKWWNTMSDWGPYENRQQLSAGTK